jgi:1-deoxy-D-xylulose-5-phosphate synthase
MTIYCPSSFRELENMLEQAIYHCGGPVAVRYPRGGEGAYRGFSSGPCEVIRTGCDITLCSYGVMINETIGAAELLAGAGVSCEIVKLNVLTGNIPAELLDSVRKTGRLVIAEDCYDSCSIGRRIAAELALSGLTAQLKLVNIKHGFVPHGSVPELLKYCGIESGDIYASAMELV